MNRFLPIFSALAISLMSNAFVPLLKAGESDKKTAITISQPVDVEGTILPAGQYVLTLLDPASSRDVVYIFNGDGTRLITAVLAIHAERLQPTDRSEFSFYDPTAGQPAALRTWFYPGNDIGLEFPRPQHTATKTPTRSRQPASQENLAQPLTN
jgi:hypothetical protein